MGEALVGGLLAAAWALPREVTIVEKLPARREELTKRFPGISVVEEAVAAEGVLIATKPNDVEVACRAAAAAGADRVVSIAAAVSIARLESWVGEGVPVVRAMPNTPALIGAGAAAISGGSHASDADLDWAESVLSAVGTVVRVPESLLDAVTGLSASGPAYVFLVAEALIEGGVMAGLPRQVSEHLARQMLLGASRLLVESGETAEALRGAVTTPGGTTAAAIRVLEDRAVRAAFIEAVVAATERSKEMGTG